MSSTGASGFIFGPDDSQADKTGHSETEAASGPGKPEEGGADSGFSRRHLIDSPSKSDASVRSYAGATAGELGRRRGRPRDRGTARLDKHELRDQRTDSAAQVYSRNHAWRGQCHE